MNFLDLDLDITLDDATECTLMWCETTKRFHVVKRGRGGDVVATYGEKDMLDMSYAMSNWNLEEAHQFFLLGFVTAKFGREAASTLV